MIAQTERAPLILRAAAPLAWRDDHTIATKLLGFAATEAGSALDMRRAAELTPDPRLRRLFFRHALDEARHAQMFRDAALALAPAARPRPHEAPRARRQDLLERLGELPFIAFVHLSERRAAAQFDVLARRFRDHSLLGPLFTRVARDERFHVRYSGQLLDERRAAGHAPAVARALRRVRLWTAWTAWRRAGRRIGDLLVGALMLTLFLTVVPLFALPARAIAARARPGWRRPADTGTHTLDALRRPF